MLHASLIIIFVYDLKHYLIPDKILFPAVLISVLYRCLEFMNLNIGHLLEIRNWKLEILSQSIAAAFIASIFFLILVLITQGRGMGLGDVKLAFLMGLILGWPNILVALFLAFHWCYRWTGVNFNFGTKAKLWKIPKLRFGGKKYSLKSQIPFGPFL